MRFWGDEGPKARTPRVRAAGSPGVRFMMKKTASQSGFPAGLFWPLYKLIFRENKKFRFSTKKNTKERKITKYA
jgi:hypothetical protein